LENEEELEGVPDPGDIIVERYRVDSILGVGGMGCVVAATHLTLDTKVAVKFLLAKAAKNPKNITRFQREAQAAAKIKSDHVAKVSDVGTLPTGVPYMVMEYLDGEDLSERLKRGPVPPAQCVDFVLQASEALAEAHRAGIIHRDLKPANLFLTHTSDGKPRIKVLDFGISKIVDGAGNDLTKTSALMGSPLYMSPEQMMSAKAADARADIWALGCILFEGITCQPPFIGETLPEICSRILTNPPAKLTELAPYAGPQLEALIEHCLQKKPEERFQTLAEMAEALAPFATLSGHKSVNTSDGYRACPSCRNTPAPPRREARCLRRSPLCRPRTVWLRVSHTVPATLRVRVVYTPPINPIQRAPYRDRERRRRAASHRAVPTPRHRRDNTSASAQRPRCRTAAAPTPQALPTRRAPIRAGPRWRCRRPSPRAPPLAPRWRKPCRARSRPSSAARCR